MAYFYHMAALSIVLSFLSVLADSQTRASGFLYSRFVTETDRILLPRVQLYPNVEVDPHICISSSSRRKEQLRRNFITSA